ncbi:bifunctional transcriptional activator/DNA repair enzyme AdaA [Allorhizobium taibaishanense]|uniref:methylated-DNA--[protein]-cysteine S-methyltransferase n=1 Tax=Allorhizobium taibaishanense TaxID=887144 RepID=A0A1Q8ZZD6_9HYPH|nr:trifunctional transcriptional activator/DNA repair protein Ada/methylated-DNA--[protein]-cysteine S-methyltransferase [Allorhizobium taibaishanense]MBB4007384.1 AraC family transcriptional regulator of adaptative response/methylated-DNA-[protein]-cysteine methyltransferase [Allorhizobium taibaishanense]OLP47647.1 6-O-methylguanine DNA methyltransferase [Allorhizobium taibaishanense]
MLFTRPTDDRLYTALVNRDASYDGFSYVCVTSTRIFCRFTCTARKPKPENCRFEDTIAACLEGGFRPCKRCRPLVAYGNADPLVQDLTQRLEAEPARCWRETDIVALGHDPSTVRRAFKRRFGMSFIEMARLRRLSLGTESLVAGDAVIDAQLDAGYSSGSGFRAAVTQLLGQAPARLKGQLQNRDLLKADWIETPIGPMLTIVDDHALHLLEFADRPALPKELDRLKTRQGCGIAVGRTAITEQIAAELAQYFNGVPDSFSVRIAGHGTPFERQVWQALRAIPEGETQSYAQVAAGLDRASAVRAVARANGANQIAIVIPCHRVIGADGNLTGYGGGLWRKQWLLNHERRMASNA